MIRITACFDEHITDRINFAIHPDGTDSYAFGSITPDNDVYCFLLEELLCTTTHEVEFKDLDALETMLAPFITGVYHPEQSIDLPF